MIFSIKKSVNKFIIFPLVALLVLVGCSETGPSALELLKIHKKDAELKFEKFYACYDIALRTPEIKEDKIDWIPGVEPTAVRENSNCHQIGIESFKDLSAPLDVRFDGTRRRYSKVTFLLSNQYGDTKKKAN